jgi:hypothetical protein
VYNYTIDKHKQEGKKMFKVEITYKSGKVEIAEISIDEYGKALKQLGEEGRTAGIRIIEVI